MLVACSENYRDSLSSLSSVIGRSDQLQLLLSSPDKHLLQPDPAVGERTSTLACGPNEVHVWLCLLFQVHSYAHKCTVTRHALLTDSIQTEADDEDWLPLRKQEAVPYAV